MNQFHEFEFVLIEHYNAFQLKRIKKPHVEICDQFIFKYITKRSTIDFIGHHKMYAIEVNYESNEICSRNIGQRISINIFH